MTANKRLCLRLVPNLKYTYQRFVKTLVYSGCTMYIELRKLLGDIIMGKKYVLDIFYHLIRIHTYTSKTTKNMFINDYIKSWA